LPHCKQTSRQKPGEGEDVGACSARLVISTDATEELFPAENTFLKETNYHKSDCWKSGGIQKHVELVGKRRKARKSKLLSVGERFVWASQPARCSLCVPQKPKKVVSRESRLSSGISCFPRSCAQKT